MKNNIGFILITILILLAGSLSFFWNYFLYKKLIIKTTPEEILFYDAKYLTRKKEEEKKKDTSSGKSADKSLELKTSFSNKNNNFRIKGKNIMNPAENFSFDFPKKLQLEKNEDISFLNNNIIKEMSLDNIYEIKKFQYGLDDKLIKFCDLTEGIIIP